MIHIFNLTEICELTQVLNIKHPFMKVILDVVSRIVNHEIINAIKKGCPFMVQLIKLGVIV